MMVAYELYWSNNDGKEHLVGILPERRKHTERITNQSVINWGKMILSDRPNVDLDSLYFIEVEI